MSGTNLMATQAALTGLATSSMAAVSLTPLTLATDSPVFHEPSSGHSTRYVIVGTAAAALGTVLAGGCSDPRPAPIANESAIPPNQSHCTPGSTSAYCTSQREVLNEMIRMREEGHHSDQSLFAILGAVAVVGAVGAFFLGRRRGRKKAERAAQEQANQAQQQPPANQDGTTKVDNK
jgi:hypothetical protein